MRPILFWVHLSLGVTAGLLVAWIAATGFLLTFRQQVTDFTERGQSRVETLPGVARLSLDLLAAKATEGKEANVSGLTLSSDSRSAVLFNLGKDEVVYVDPYTGKVLGPGAPVVRSFFRTVEGLHRWFGMTEGPAKERAHQFKAAVNLVFLFMVLSGLYLWWPRSGKAVLKFKPGLTAKARDWNQHNVLGFWISWILVVITGTGVVMSYDWANDLLYRLTGDAPPPHRQAMLPTTEGKGPGAEVRKEDHRPSRIRRDKGAQAAGWDAWATAAKIQSPGWRAISLRLPRKEGDKVMSFIQEGDSPYRRSVLSLEPDTAAVAKWEPYAEQKAGRKLRGLMKPLHIGEALGFPGQTLTAFAALGTVWMVWTGLAMAWRRWRSS
ncbi:MAG TPA: PepSY-associated TM helix domain-containing protein [bacterium]|nr:PepSY-associated TM helix domain-containing protein [bacterium]